jgi:hypothetical protein
MLVRDESGRFFEVDEGLLEGHEVEPPLHDHDASFPAPHYRWDLRDNPAECTERERPRGGAEAGVETEAAIVVHYHW